MLILAGIAVVAPAVRAQAQGRCSGVVVSDTYDASSGVTPDALPVDPWLRDDASGTGVDAVSGGLLTIDATGGNGGDQLSFVRGEDLGGVSSYYRIEASYAVVSSAPSGDSAVVSSVQDRQVILTTYSNGEVWMMLHVPGYPSVVEAVLVDTVSPAALHDYVVDATRNGPVTLTIDGVPVTGQVTLGNGVSLAWPLPWDALPYIPGAGTTGLGPTVGFSFGAAGVVTEWKRAHFEACRPGNVAVAIQTVVPAPGASRVLKGGMGETLDGLTGLTATLDRVDVVEETVPGDTSTAQVITVSNGPQPVTFATSLDDTSIRPMTGLTVPPGTVTQVRLVVSGMTIDLRGATYPVKVPSGAQTGIKVNVENGALAVPQTGETGLVIQLSLFDHLIRNRGQGFVMPPVMKHPACICTIDDLTGECTSIVDPTCGQSSSGGGGTGGGGGPRPVIQPARCQAPAGTTGLVVINPFPFSTSRGSGHWLDDHAFTQLYQSGLDYTLPIVASLTVTQAELGLAPGTDVELASGDSVDFDGGATVLSGGTAGAVFPGPSFMLPRPPPWSVRFQSDHDGNVSTGISLGSIRLTCDPTRDPLPTSFQGYELRTPNAEMGALMRTGDAVIFHVPATPVAQDILLDGPLAAPGGLPPNFDLEAWQGTPFSETPGTRVTGRTSIAQEFIRLPPGGAYTVVVVSRRGSGWFAIKRTLEFAGGSHEINVGVEYDAATGAGGVPAHGQRCYRVCGCVYCASLQNPDGETLPRDCTPDPAKCSKRPNPPGLPVAMAQVETALCRNMKQIYSGFEGAGLIDTARVWAGDTTCGGALRLLNCTVVVRHWLQRPATTGFPLHIEIGDNELEPHDSWYLEHEMGHLRFSQCDEYSDWSGSDRVWGPSCIPPISEPDNVMSRSNCGHSFMNGPEDGFAQHSLCTAAEHGRDSREVDPNTSQPLTDDPPAGWVRLLLAHRAPYIVPELGIRTLGALPVTRNTFAGKFRIIRMNYTDSSGSRIRICH